MGERSGPGSEHLGACSRGRRHCLKGLAGAGIALGCAWEGAVADDDQPRAGDALVSVEDPTRPLGPADITPGAKQLIALPFVRAEKRPRDRTRLNRILLIRPQPAGLDAESLARAADGILAYSAICTHQACDVNSWREKEQTLLCFCHFSQFQPAAGGAVVAGPAPRPLPWLPLAVQDGLLVLAGGFSAAPGPG